MCVYWCVSTVFATSVCVIHIICVYSSDTILQLFRVVYTDRLNSFGFVVYFLILKKN